MTESAEGARLLSECTPKGVPRVRIPLSPPFFGNAKKWRDLAKSKKPFGGSACR
jgi:putative endonuclease